MFQEDIFLLLISKERFLLVFFVFLSMGKAYDTWNCTHCPVTMWEQPQNHEDADPKPGHCRATKPILEMPVSRLLVR